MLIDCTDSAHCELTKNRDSTQNPRQRWVQSPAYVSDLDRRVLVLRESARGLGIASADRLHFAGSSWIVV